MILTGQQLCMNQQKNMAPMKHRGHLIWLGVVQMSVEFCSTEFCDDQYIPGAPARLGTSHFKRNFDKLYYIHICASSGIRGLEDTPLEEISPRAKWLVSCI